MTRFLRWFLPGLGLKRWLLVSSFGIFLISIGISVSLKINMYAFIGSLLFKYVSYSAAMFFQGPIFAGIAVILVGVILAMWGISRLVQSVLHTLISPPEGVGVAEAFYQRRSLVRGPKVVAIGGGTGLPTLLRGMKPFTSNIAAVVTVADDGGSSGRLRSEFGILPPGDIRNCLVALADTEPLMERLFQHRFANGEGLAGHPFGNLFILAMSETIGNFYDAVQASSQVLAIRGRVMPSTLDQVILKAQLTNGDVVVGESIIGKSCAPIRRVFLNRVGEDEGADVRPLDDAITAIEHADVIVLGPGSLYTSIIPNLLVPGIAEAVRRSRALKIYVCNIMTEPGETDQYTVSQHIKALIDHAGYGIIGACIANAAPIPPLLRKRYLEKNAIPVAVDERECNRLGVDLIEVDLLDTDQELVRHHSDKLAYHIGQLVLNRRMNLERTPWDFFMLRQHLQERRKQEERR